MSRVLITANAAWNIVNFRSGLVRALIADGHDVIAAVPEADESAAINALGARTIALPIGRGSVSILADLLVIARYVRLLRRERPAILLSWTIKPNIYGAFAAALCGVPAIVNISGLGTAFIRIGWLTRIVERLYRIGLRRAATVFFQNADDRARFVEARLVPIDRTALLPGSGIDLAAFDPAPPPPARVFRFLLVARLIRDKGIHDYVEAARRLGPDHPDVWFEIVGPLDPGNRTAIPAATLQSWVDARTIVYHGAVADVRPAIARADCIVLPSYREGLPRVLLEAAAMARPVIATDVPGCRDVVIDDRTGLLCRARDPAALAATMARMLALPVATRARMGHAARAHVADRFAETLVINRYRRAIADAVRQ